MNDSKPSSYQCNSICIRKNIKLNGHASNKNDGLVGIVNECFWGHDLTLLAKDMEPPAPSVVSKEKNTIGLIVSCIRAKNSLIAKGLNKMKLAFQKWEVMSSNLGRD